MAAEIQIIENSSIIQVGDGNAAVVQVFDAGEEATKAKEDAEDALEQVSDAIEEVNANHVEIILNSETNELYALWGVD